MLLKLRKLFGEWGVPAGILALWGFAAVYTVHALIGMERATLQFQSKPAAVRSNT